MSITLEQQRDNRKEYLRLLSGAAHSDVPNCFYDYLEGTVFWVAPASTKYHENYAGGLVVHSLNVYRYLSDLNEHHELGLSLKSVVKVSLLHDLCKTNFYRLAPKNKKLDDGRWVRVQEYTVNDDFPIGHGEKSLAIALRHGIILSDNEILAIRWHMGAFSQGMDYMTGQTLSSAMQNNRLVVALQVAALMSVYLNYKQGGLPEEASVWMQ